MELKKKKLIEHKNHYRCGWAIYRRAKLERKLIYKEQKDKEKLAKFCTENKIYIYSRISERFSLNFLGWMGIIPLAIRLFNVCFGIAAGKPLYKFESIPNRDKKKRRFVYLEKLCMTLSILSPVHPYYKDVTSRMKWKPFWHLITPGTVSEWLTESGIDIKEIKEISKYSCYGTMLLEYLEKKD